MTRILCASGFGLYVKYENVHLLICKQISYIIEHIQCSINTCIELRLNALNTRTLKETLGQVK